MPELKEALRIRYPPFEAHRWHPENLPIASVETRIGEYNNVDEALEALNAFGPSFMLGDTNGWCAQRTYVFDGVEVPHAQHEPHLETKQYALPAKRQRRGWYLVPNPIHSLVRRFINAAVIVLLAALAYLFVSPLLIWLGVPTYGLATVRWGLLDYPALAVYVIPLVFAPLALRIMANLAELRRQNIFLQRTIDPPTFSFLKPTVADQPLEVDIAFPSWEPDWGDVDVMWRVGLLPPSRETLLSSLNRPASRQPPPGLSTELPHHWEAGLDDGTAGGEDAPMERRELTGGFYLRPMRIMSASPFVSWNRGSATTLPAIEQRWPGSVTGDLIRVHWECVVRIQRQQGGALLWVQPLRVAHGIEPVEHRQFELHDGRSELESW